MGYIEETISDDEQISIIKIEEVDLKQSIIGRLLGYGSVSISGTGSGQIFLKSIDLPIRGGIIQNTEILKD